jgi:hypothetical protein
LGKDHDSTGPVGEALEHLDSRIGPADLVPAADTDFGIDRSDEIAAQLGEITAIM